MQSAKTVTEILRARGRRGLPCDELYRQLFNPALFLMAWGRIYANNGAMTAGINAETADGMSLAKIGRIIGALRHERYRFQPVRRVHIPKKSGGTRPLGLPSWSDKLLGEVVRILLEAYYEPRFSGSSHGFRPGRGCHTALTEVEETWKGTTWFIEGDIRDCFGSLDHDVMIAILAENIHDNRFLRLVRGMLGAGYLEDWRWNATLLGAPQGGVVTPPTQQAISASRPRWVTGGWSAAGERRGAGRAGHAGGADGRGVDRAGGGAGAVSGIMTQIGRFRLLLDVICSIFMSCLGIAARMPRSTRRMSTLPWACWSRGSRRLRRRACWPGGWAARNGRRAATSARPRRRAGSRSRKRARCSRCGFPPGWRPGSGSTPARPGARSPRSPRRRWRSSSAALTGTIRAGEGAAGGDRARLQPSCCRRNVSGLRDIGAAAAGQDRRPRGGRRRP